MKTQLIKYINENDIDLFETKSIIENKLKDKFKTTDSKKTFDKTIKKITNNFKLQNTKLLLNLFFNEENITKKQEYFKQIKQTNNEILSEIKKDKILWKPKYSMIIITDEFSTYKKLKQDNLPAMLIENPNDLEVLFDYDIIKAYDTQKINPRLEQIDKIIFVNNYEELFIEQNLTKLSEYETIISLFKENNNTAKQLFEIITKTKQEENKEDYSNIEKEIKEINENINNQIKELTIKGTEIINLFEKKIPPQIKQIIEKELTIKNININLINYELPISINYEELENIKKEIQNNKYINFFKTLKENQETILNIPKLLKELITEILIFDFECGINKYTENKNYPTINQELKIEKSENLFLNKATPITFYLNENEKCSILTGANSGGKTTLLEHMIQLLTLSYIGLPTSGNNQIKNFDSIYYFAKNKGSKSKGAFETLLTQLATINSENSLILADEIESVTEPGAAGKIIISTINYFIQKNCYMIIATHLGQEIINELPNKARIDGIRAKGLDDNFNLIVDHNPTLGKIANSTPELIIKRLSKINDNEYFKFLNEYIN